MLQQYIIMADIISSIEIIVIQYHLVIICYKIWHGLNGVLIRIRVNIVYHCF